MYIVVAVLMLVRGFVDAVMMRAQQAIAYLDPGLSCRRITTTRFSRRTASS